MSSIDFSQLTFRYKRHRAAIFQNLNLQLDARPTLLLGRNGAGKSTLLQLAAGILRAPPGAVQRNGTVSYLPQQFVAIPGLDCHTYVAQLSWLAGRPKKDALDDAQMWLEKVGLAEFVSRSNTQLSGGQQSRLALAVALNSHADFVLLDEPGAALDPLSKRDLHNLYGLVTEQGRGLVVSSHDPTDIHAAFERVVLIDSGNVRFDGSLDEFSTQPHSDELVAAFQRAMHYSAE